MGTLAHGIQTLDGVEFDVRGLIQVGSVSRAGKQYPKQVSNIAVGLVCQRLLFLHAAINAGGVPAEDLISIALNPLH